MLEDVFSVVLFMYNYGVILIIIYGKYGIFGIGLLCFNVILNIK